VPQDSTALQTFVFALVAGVLLIGLARRIRVPSIVLLLLGGIALGPQFLGFIVPSHLGDGLKTVVACAVAIILFEGGLTLDLRGYRAASLVIQRLLSVGVLITWLLTAAIIWALFRQGLLFSLLAGSLVIVTGPTVIGPLLKRVRVDPRVHHILHWESVLIDAVGVFIAVLCFEWMSPEVGGGAAFVQFLGRIATGVGIGLAGGLIADQMLRRRWVPEEMINPFALAAALAVLGACELVFAESGLLGVIVTGFTLAVRAPRKLKQIQEFKAQLTDLLIGLLFMLLAANLDLGEFLRFGWRLPLAVAAVMFLVRPLNVFASAAGTGLNVREKLFLSWVAPRGIVAASMASLFAIILGERGHSSADFLEPFTYSVIAATVVIQGFSAGIVAHLLGLLRPPPNGWLIVGANRFACEIARFIAQEAKVPCTLVDSNARLVNEAASNQLDAIRADALDPTLTEALEEREIGNVLALTDNEDLNTLVCQRWAPLVGSHRAHRWVTSGAGKAHDESKAGAPVWPSIPRPSVLSAELPAGHARLLVRTTPLPAKRPGHTLLAASVDGDIALAKVPEGTLPETARFLYLRRELDYLVRSLNPQLILRLEMSELGEIIRATIDRAVQVEPKLSREESLRELLDRGLARGSAVGHGVAVPHVYSKGMTKRMCAIVQTPRGAEIPTPDDAPVRLIILIMNPVGDPEGHLATLADIARLISDSERMERIFEAAVPEGVLDLIQKALTYRPAM
jgi:NhaP-type Na+/H+ or K+/H+ antiporter/mannitol/fructose-specific phosphotransferase system IIA component (Ntr-type)